MKTGLRLGVLSVLAMAAAAHAQPDSSRAPSPAALTAPAPAAAPAGPDSLAAAATGAKPPAAKPSARAAPRARRVPFEAVTLGVRHRVFHDFRDVHRVKLNQDFPLGDSDFSARVVQYLPDFQMDLASRRFFSLGDQPNNPAFQLIVREGKVPQDTTWAFLNSPPHFGAKSYFAFQVLKVELAGRPPLLADTTSRPSRPGGHSPGAAPSPAPRDSARKP
jgi:hypothetical protein